MAKSIKKKKKLCHRGCKNERDCCENFKNKTENISFKDVTECVK